jgi:hypothetical protein
MTHQWRRYIGPSDSLGRCITGDIVSYEQFIADPSPWINTVIHAGIFARFAWMVSTQP